MSDTRTRIINTALELFNDRGSHRVTTNHIAEEMGISPGNLYYHFRNKEEIIQEIFQRIITDFGHQWNPEQFQQLNGETLVEKYKENCRLFYRYRFFYLEISSLLANDSELKKIYTRNQENRFSQINTFITVLMNSNIILKITEEEINSLITSTWILFEYWLTFLTVSNRMVTPESIEESIVHIYHVIKPYLSDEVRNAFGGFIREHYLL
jgi:AcrR family transcriptional regulator